MVNVFFRGFGAWVEEHGDIFYKSESYLASGVFVLSQQDEISYRHTKNLKLTSYLLPSSHPDSEHSRLRLCHEPWCAGNDFWMLVPEEKFCYFVIHQTDVLNIVDQESEENPGSLFSLEQHKNYISNKLLILNRAAYEFWSDVEPSEKEIHPTNEEVHNWLKQQGFSEISAKQGAVIIRPEWAALGRRPAK